MRPHSLWALSLAFFCGGAWAVTLDSQIEESANYLSASAERASFTLPRGSLDGNGGRIDFSHFFQNHINFDFYLSMALNNQNAISTSFTGTGGYFYYTLLGDFGNLKKTLKLDNQPVLIERRKKRSSLQLGVGLDQFFLNGSSTVYSVSGAGAGAKFRFPLFGQDAEVAGRYSMMSADGLVVHGLFLSLGLSFPL